jgi:hypothetical protein
MGEYAGHARRVATVRRMIRYRKHDDTVEREYVVTIELPTPSEADNNRPFLPFCTKSLRSIGDISCSEHPSVTKILAQMQHRPRKQRTTNAGHTEWTAGTEGKRGVEYALQQTPLALTKSDRTKLDTQQPVTRHMTATTGAGFSAWDDAHVADQGPTDATAVHPIEREGQLSLDARERHLQRGRAEEAEIVCLMSTISCIPFRHENMETIGSPLVVRARPDAIALWTPVAGEAKSIDTALPVDIRPFDWRQAQLTMLASAPVVFLRDKGEVQVGTPLLRGILHAYYASAPVDCLNGVASQAWKRSPLSPRIALRLIIPNTRSHVRFLEFLLQHVAPSHVVYITLPDHGIRLCRPVHPGQLLWPHPTIVQSGSDLKESQTRKRARMPAIKFARRSRRS